MPDKLKVVFFGDIVGRPGREAIISQLPKIKKAVKPDLVIANVENLAHGKGVTEKTLGEFRESGIDVFTSGEHIYDKAKDEEAALFEKFPNLLKPINFKTEVPGRGEIVVDTPKGKVLVTSLIGQVFMRTGNLSPWTMLPEIIERHKDAAIKIVDFHAEATSEKLALARHFDGQITALFGTHTHIPTADAAILPSGTAYVTDVGMNGPYDSVLGMKSEVSIERFLSGEHVPYDIAEAGRVWLNYVVVEFDVNAKKAIKIEHQHQIIEL